MVKFVIYVLNFDWYFDRFVCMMQQVMVVGIVFECILVVDVFFLLDMVMDVLVVLNGFILCMFKGVCVCIVSYIDMYWWFLKIDVDYVLIFEDDVVLLFDLGVDVVGFI